MACWPSRIEPSVGSPLQETSPVAAASTTNPHIELFILGTSSSETVKNCARKSPEDAQA
jgi:hypothetical protein